MASVVSFQIEVIWICKIMCYAQQGRTQFPPFKSTKGRQAGSEYPNYNHIIIKIMFKKLYPFTPFSMNIFLGWTNLILKTHPKKIYFGQSYLITNIGVLAWNIIFRAILGLNNRAKIFLL